MHIPLALKKIYRTFYWRFINILSSGSATRIHYIDPEDIHYGQTPESQFRAKSIFRFIRSGDWDRELIPIEGHPLFISFRDRFINKKDWQETIFYRDALSQINRGVPFRGILAKDELDLRFKKCDELFSDIRENGYKSNLDLYQKGKLDNPINLLDEITVNIDRGGKMILNDGWHRFSIARLLNISRVPVRVLMRHPSCRKKSLKTGKRMSIFYSTGMYSTKYGGIERMLVNLTQKLSAMGHSIFLQFECPPVDQDFLNDIQNAGGTIVIIRTKGRIIRGFFGIFTYIRRNGIDMIHANFNPAKDICVYAGVLAGVKKIVCHFRTMESGKPRTGFRLWFLSHFSDVNLAVSEAVKRDLVERGALPDKIHVLYDGSFVPAVLKSKS
ncbi:MAG: glycosyltransferase, partial [Candidatus Omnitrophica bacterium]|nr:glycosyltransferase [Candidatus Omnitrophota bacterium]